MSDSIILYQFVSSELSVEIKAGFENGDLIIEGFDVGKSVEKLLGDFDYEYSLRVPEAELYKLAAALNFKQLDAPDQLLQAIAARFNGNQCFSQFRDFLNVHAIPFQSFSF